MNRPPSSHPRHAFGVWLMLLSTVCFAINVLLVRALGHFQIVNVWLISCTRFAAGLLLIGAMYRRDFQPLHLFRNPRLIGRGLVGGIGVAGFYFAVVHIGAGRATFINNLYIVFGALLAVWVLRERFDRRLAGGSVAALAGLALLTGAFEAGSRVTLFDLIALGVACGSAYVVVTIRQLHATEHTSTIFASQCVYGLLICGAPAALHPEPVSLLAWALMLAVGAFAAIGQIAMTRAYRELPVAEGSLLQILVPIEIAVGGMVCFGERFSPHELAGAALILAGTGFTSLGR